MNQSNNEENYNAERNSWSADDHDRDHSSDDPTDRVARISLVRAVLRWLRPRPSSCPPRIAQIKQAKAEAAIRAKALADEAAIADIELREDRQATEARTAASMRG